MASKQGKKLAGATNQEPLRIRIVCKDGLTTGVTIEDADTGRPIKATRLELLPVDVSQGGGAISARIEVTIDELDLTMDCEAVPAEIGQLQRHIEKEKNRLERICSRHFEEHYTRLNLAADRVDQIRAEKNLPLSDCIRLAAGENKLFPSTRSLWIFMRNDRRVVRRSFEVVTLPLS